MPVYFPDKDWRKVGVSVGTILVKSYGACKIYYGGGTPDASDGITVGKPMEVKCGSTDFWVKSVRTGDLSVDGLTPAVWVAGPGTWEDSDELPPRVIDFVPPPPPPPSGDLGVVPDGAELLWLILGQSNALGFSPAAQDPAKTNVANAVSNLLAGEEATHPFIKFTPGSDANQTFSLRPFGNVANNTGGKTWTSGTYGIPNPTYSFGPEVGLIQWLLDTDYFIDEVDPKVRVAKLAKGSTSVDDHRFGGTYEVLDNFLSQTGSESISFRAANADVLAQGAIVVIGETDANNAKNGLVKSGTYARRAAEYLRQVRHRLGVPNMPVAICTILPASDADRIAVNTEIAALAADDPNTTFVDCTDLAGAETASPTHYDGPSMRTLANRALTALRAYGRAGDGLNVNHVVNPSRPSFLLPLVATDHVGGNNVKAACVGSVSGNVKFVVLPVGSSAPTAAAISASPDGVFSVTGGALFNNTIGAVFDNTATEEVYYILEDSEGLQSPVMKYVRNPTNKFLSPTPNTLTGTSGGITGNIKNNIPATVYMSVFPAATAPLYMSMEDVEDRAFNPAYYQEFSVPANTETSAEFLGMTPGNYVLFISSRANVGHPGEVWKVSFTAT